MIQSIEGFVKVTGLDYTISKFNKEEDSTTLRLAIWQTFYNFVNNFCGIDTSDIQSELRKPEFLERLHERLMESPKYADTHGKVSKREKAKLIIGIHRIDERKANLEFNLFAQEFIESNMMALIIELIAKISNVIIKLQKEINSDDNNLDEILSS